MLRTSYASRRIEAYTTLVSALLDQGETERAFEVADRSRGRALLEHEAARSMHGGQSTSGRSNLSESEQLLRLMANLSTELREYEMYPPEERIAADSIAIQDLTERLVGARSDYEALLARSAGDPATDDVLLGASGVGAEQIIGALQSSEALLQYFVTSDRLIGFVAMRGGVESFAVPISSDVLVRRVRIARDFIGSPEMSSSARQAVMEGLFEVLLSPAVQAGHLDGVESLTIVPHGVLNYLPFDALIDSTSGRYLAADYGVQVLPAASALPVLRQRFAQRGEAAPSDVGGVAFAPLPQQLPATRAEVRAFSKAVGGGRAVTGGKATEQQVRETLARPGNVHIATHGTMNVRNPLFSRIELAPGSGDPDDDGRLEVHELLDMSIMSQLVFLSGCETGVGTAWSTEFAHGEDYATLGRAFLYAGAQNVVATLWRVEDEGAAAFAASFYEFLVDYTPVEALARAQREMMMHERYSAPYYWAAYQIAGPGVAKSTAQLSGL
jgi:CHAT domain-containing protein